MIMCIFLFFSSFNLQKDNYRVQAVKGGRGDQGPVVCWNCRMFQKSTENERLQLTWPWQSGYNWLNLILNVVVAALVVVKKPKIPLTISHISSTGTKWRSWSWWSQWCPGEENRWQSCARPKHILISAGLASMSSMFIQNQILSFHQEGRTDSWIRRKTQCSPVGIWIRVLPVSTQTL